MTWATHEGEQGAKYLAARAPLLKTFAEARAPHWLRFMNGEIDHAEYRSLIESAAKVYSKAMEPHWVAAGGTPNKKEHA